MLIGVFKGKYDQQNLAGVSTQGAGQSWRIGFLVGITNPKTATFFATLFVTLLPVGAPPLIYIAVVALVGSITSCGFACWRPYSQSAASDPFTPASVVPSMPDGRRPGWSGRENGNKPLMVFACGFLNLDPGRWSDGCRAGGSAFRGCAECPQG